MPENLKPQIETRAELPEDIAALGPIGVKAAIAVESNLGSEQVTRVAETANYQGNWMLAQQERMTDPDFKAKYERLVDESLPGLKEGEPGEYDKPEQFQMFHQALVATYDDRNSHVYSAVGYAPAQEYGLGPRQTGRGGVGERGTVFSDATTMDDVPLTNRQKDIIAAHEAYHGAVKAPAPVLEELGQAFDEQVYFDEVVGKGSVKRPGYLQKPDELMARMAQLKNYFGMKGDEQFTNAHLEYARAHYVKDTELDNSMSTMFRIISPRTEPNFLRLMNTLPV